MLDVAGARHARRPANGSNGDETAALIGGQCKRRVVLGARAAKSGRRSAARLRGGADEDRVTRGGERDGR